MFNVFELFSLFNDQYFYGKLGCVRVEWSNRMTLCAGVCIFKGGNDVAIRLSEKLLQFRPESDLINTLLHEMIHAFLFLTARLRSGHGPDFIFHMRRINEAAGTNITIFHNFHAEVSHFRIHEWRCTGSCRFKAPFFGSVKRAINRAPSKADWWWSRHLASCGGTFVKVSSPEALASCKRKKKKSILANGSGRRSPEICQASTFNRTNSQLNSSDSQLNASDSQLNSSDSSLIHFNASNSSSSESCSSPRIVIDLTAD